VTKNYRREQNVTWEENNCVEGNAYITYHRQQAGLCGKRGWPSDVVLEKPLAVFQADGE
jgi:hypothetical protein